MHTCTQTGPKWGPKRSQNGLTGMAHRDGTMPVRGSKTGPKGAHRDGTNLMNLLTESLDPSQAIRACRNMARRAEYHLSKQRRPLEAALTGIDALTPGANMGHQEAVQEEEEAVASVAPATAAAVAPVTSPPVLQGQEPMDPELVAAMRLVEEVEAEQAAGAPPDEAPAPADEAAPGDIGGTVDAEMAAEEEGIRQRNEERRMRLSAAEEEGQNDMAGPPHGEEAPRRRKRNRKQEREAEVEEREAEVGNRECELKEREEAVT